MSDSDTNTRKNGKADSRQKEDEEIKEKQAVSAYVVYRAIEEEAKDELARSSRALAWSGLAAGLSIGFSFIAEALLTYHLEAAGAWKPLVTKFGYSVGFLIVVLGRQQLFTENTLTPVLPLLGRRDHCTLTRVLRLWAVVLATNLIGTALFALALAKLPLFEPPLSSFFTELAQTALRPDFWTILIRAIFAGWLIALMVWLLPAAEGAKLWVIVILTYLIGIAHFSHVIAGSNMAFYLAWIGERSWGNVVGGFIVPALIGNIIGGVALVAALNYAQATSDVEEE